MTATAKQTRMRRFVLNRTTDVTGTSGTGIVAEGVQLSSGQVVLTWFSLLNSVAVYANMTVIETLHGHGGEDKPTAEQVSQYMTLALHIVQSMEKIGS